MPTGTTYVDYTVTNASVLTYYFTFPILDVDHIVVVTAPQWFKAPITLLTSRRGLLRS